MIKFKSISMRNFMSTGAIEQTVDLNKTDLTMILGENLDLGGLDVRNGVGKSVLLQAISYALFNWPLNKVKMDNLINRTNEKNMHVTIEYSVNGIDYKIIRGRKPNILKYYVNSSEQKISDDAQGENKETQAVIEKVLGMSHLMFKNIVLLNTYNEPFLSMKAAEQRIIIEQLLGITLLTEKAEALKEHIKATREQINLEEITINANVEANKRINEQIVSLERRQSVWNTNHNKTIDELKNSLRTLLNVDPEHELAMHDALEQYLKQYAINEQYNSIKHQYDCHDISNNTQITELTTKLDTLKQIDINTEIQNHIFNIEVDNQISTNKNNILIKKKLQKEIDGLDGNLTKLTNEITKLLENVCYACGGQIHDDNQSKLLDAKQNALSEIIVKQDTLQAELDNVVINVIPDKKPTVYATKLEAMMHEQSVQMITEQLVKLQSTVNPYAYSLESLEYVKLGVKPQTHYATRDECIKHGSILKSTIEQITKREHEVDPYIEQIADMKTNAVVAVDYTKLNELTKLADHQKFVLDLLIKPDSFIRKKIIDQTLPQLNQRLSYYLDRLNLPHLVVFKSDLTVEISELGRDTDFDSLSRGERNRVILGLSFAFRDIWESIYQPINILFVDELIDNGLDTSGVESALAIMKDFGRDRAKSVWLVTHREELINRIPNVLKVVKESGFTSYK